MTTCSCRITNCQGDKNYGQFTGGNHDYADLKATYLELRCDGPKEI